MKKSKSYIGFQIFNHFLMTVMMIIMLYPLWYVLVASLSDSIELLRLGGKPMLMPKGLTVSAYKMAF